MASLTLDQLPDELIITIFSYLDLESIRSIQIVCKSFAQLLEDEVFWFSKCQRGKFSATTSESSHNLHSEFVFIRNGTRTPCFISDVAILCLCSHSFLLSWQKVGRELEVGRKQKQCLRSLERVVRRYASISYWARERAGGMDGEEGKIREGQWGMVRGEGREGSRALCSIAIISPWNQMQIILWSFVVIILCMQCRGWFRGVHKGRVHSLSNPGSAPV